MGFRAKLRAIWEVEDTPHRIALSFALGVLWGMSPFLGIHTIGAFFTAWLLGMNRFVAVVGVYITNPWTIIPIYSFSLWFGAKLTGTEQILPDIAWDNVSFTYLIDKLSHLIPPFFVGTFTVGVISSIISYFVIYGVLLRYRNRIKHGA